MKNRGHLWAIVLAAGEGTRLRSLTTDEQGVPIPKQFCTFHGDPEGRSMLRSTLQRAERIVPKERIVTIVATEHSHWWQHELADFPQENVVIQPMNRGTAMGVLLPLFHVFLKDRHATVLILPSDHYVDDEEILQEAFEQTFLAMNEKYQRVILLGMEPESADPGYGYIIPASNAIGKMNRVSRFIEKPPVSVAERLMQQGGLWNSFMFAGSVNTLLRLFVYFLPELMEPFLLGRGDLESLYESLPVRDFSRDLLEKAVDHLLVLPVPPCGWSDLGTPQRIESVSHRHADFDSRRMGKLIRLPHQMRKQTMHH